MNQLNPLLLVGLVINIMVTLYIVILPGYEILAWIHIPFILLNIIGILFIIAQKPKTGSILFIIGCIAFVPIGIIGILGARKILDAIKTEKFITKLNS